MSKARRIELLGGLAVHCHGKTITRFRTQKTAALLAFLAYHAERHHTREYLIDLLWPDSDECLGRQNLSTALTSLRHQLEPPGVEPGSVLQADRRVVRVMKDAFALDVDEFEAAIAEADGVVAEGSPIRACQRAIELYKGPLLPGFDEEWCIYEGIRLHEEYCRILCRLARCHEESGRTEAAISVARKAVAAEPLFDEHKDLLNRLLEAHPHAPPETLTEKEETLGLETPESLSGSHAPTFRSRFFGRESEISGILDLLHSPRASIVTLTGPGGIGKTRLALEVERELVDSRTRRCFYVPLADFRDASAIPPAVAVSMGLPSTVADSLIQIAGFLSGEPTLLILDNFEHLSAGAVWVRQLAQRCRQVVILVTSRHRLGLEEEIELPIAPLPRPPIHCELPLLAASPAVALFVDRAQRCRPDFQLTPRNGPDVAALCEGLECIPLAIELAAARSQVMTPAQMLDQLENRFGFLVNKKRPMIERHRTMALALQWSFDLLRPELQEFFAKLSVFRGGLDGRGSCGCSEGSFGYRST